MGVVLVERLRQPRPFVAAAMIGALITLASIASISARGNPAAPAASTSEASMSPARIDAASGATAACEKPNIPTPQAGDGAKTCPAEPGSGTDDNSRRALILLMLGNAVKRPFGPFK